MATNTDTPAAAGVLRTVALSAIEIEEGFNPREIDSMNELAGIVAAYVEHVAAGQPALLASRALLDALADRF